MPSLVTQMLKCYLIAKHVDHYYWMHTPTEDGEKINIENIQKIVGLMTGMSIEKEIINVPDNPYRGFIDRYPDRIKIWVNEDQSVPSGQEYETEPWQKHSTIKELSHLLLDQPDSYEPDPDNTLLAMFEYSGPFLQDGMSPIIMSENLAEILAMEIHYPLEFRKIDRAYLDKGGDIKELVKKRQVPELIIQRASASSYISMCESVWEELPKMGTPPLDEYLK